jgi:A/G-specific adenine glycosylase
LADEKKFDAPPGGALSPELFAQRYIYKSRSALLDWYDREHRSLPWRDRTGAYGILVSEIMLQQTRVDTVVPYWRRFLEAFPTVDDLARAPLDRVLALWSGLGYYRRARLLHQAAISVVERGAFPRTAAELVELPGVGPYTAAAVASIAFGERVAVVDGNVERVASRLLALELDVRGKRGKAAVRELATELLDPERPGDGNQALMELGALVCSPTSPDCAACALAHACLAREQGIQESFPVRAPRRRQVQQRRLLVLVERDGRLLLFRNADDATLLAGLWELPTIDRPARTRAERERGLRNELGGRWSLGKVVAHLRHGITFRDLRVEVRRGELLHDGEIAEGREAGWFTREQLSELPTSALVAKVLRELG